jgi:DNA replication licensing factor MCM5
MQGFDNGEASIHAPANPQGEPYAKMERKLLEFLQTFRIGDSFYYRYLSFLTQTRSSQQLINRVLVKQYYIDVLLSHLFVFDEELANTLQSRPSEILPLVPSS